MMRTILFCFFLLWAAGVYAQEAPAFLEIKTALGGTGISVKPTVSVMASYPLTRRWSVAAHTMYSFLMVKNFKQSFIKTNYNYSLTQKFGVGYSLYGSGGNSRHTVLVMGGIKYVAFSETMANPELDAVTTSTRTVLPEYGLMYELSLGRKRCTFDTRLYLPFHPIQVYPMGTLTNLAYLEFGIGVKLNRSM